MTSCNLVIGAICARVISMRAFEHMIPSSSGEHILRHSLPALTLIAGAASALAAAMLPVVVRAQTSPAPGPGSTLEPIEVTGSLIRSTDRVTFNQVQVVTAQDIEASGEVTVADYLRDLAVNSASSWGDNFAYGATGGAGIAMRGLSEKYTLVLVDGQRVAPYGFPSNGTDTFVDLNTIPLNAIDRIEIVKTGAVSQYGSDAIGGGVNIITKHDFQGLQLDGSY